METKTVWVDSEWSQIDSDNCEFLAKQHNLTFEIKKSPKKFGEGYIIFTGAEKDIISLNNECWDGDASAINTDPVKYWENELGKQIAKKVKSYL